MQLWLQQELKHKQLLMHRQRKMPFRLGLHTLDRLLSQFATPGHMPSQMRVLAWVDF